jgi:hypothetical protein
MDKIIAEALYWRSLVECPKDVNQRIILEEVLDNILMDVEMELAPKKKARVIEQVRERHNNS